MLNSYGVVPLVEVSNSTVTHVEVINLQSVEEGHWQELLDVSFVIELVFDSLSCPSYQVLH